MAGNQTALSNILGLSTGTQINTNGGNLSLTFASPFTLGSSINLSTNGGNFIITSPGALTLTGAVITDGGNITLNGATINSVAGTLDSSSTTRAGGDIRFTANSDIDTGTLNSSSTAIAGGSITLTSQTGAITTEDLNSSGQTSGGDILVSARSRITTGFINSSSSTGNGGNVTLDPENDIQVAAINAQGGSNGTGGTVDITTGRFFRATDTFTDNNGIVSSISTVGGNGGGNITIRHGGQGVTAFDVGSGTTNGTAGAITSGNFTIAPFQSFPYTYNLGNIQIISIDQPNIDDPSLKPIPLPSYRNDLLINLADPDLLFP